MSSPMSESEVFFLQRTCSTCGVYEGPIDGVWSDAVAIAEEKLETEGAKLRQEFGSFDPRSERNIASLMPPAQKVARCFMSVASGFDFKVRIISGSRTYAEQDALYAIGQTIELEKDIVTKAKGGESKHNFGIAWDVGLFAADGAYLTGKKPGENETYERLAAFLKPSVPDLEWGGDWEGFMDRPHYQLATGLSAAEVRGCFETGRPLNG